MRDSQFISVANAAQLTERAQMRCGFITELKWAHNGKLLAVAHGRGVNLWADGFGGAPTRTLEAHDGPVKGLAFTPDDRVIATAGADTTVRLWLALDGRPLSVLRAHQGSVESVTFNNITNTTRALVASGGGDQMVYVFDLTESVRFIGLQGHSNDVTCVKFSPDSRLLASGSWDHTVRLWDVQNEHLLTEMQHDDWVRDLAFSPDGNLLATASKDSTVALWDPATGEQRFIFHAHDGGADCLAFSPDGRLLATGGRDHAIKLWDLAAPSQTPVVALSGHDKPVLTVAFHPNGHMLASGSGDNTIRLWSQPSAASQAH
ncbi:MAG: WD40 repeat domain-containing protein [Chloroflexi bacterium]|nr:WD40 repeat domain-containing protein [Chloroflexota bacterium]